MNYSGAVSGSIFTQVCSLTMQLFESVPYSQTSLGMIQQTTFLLYICFSFPLSQCVCVRHHIMYAAHSLYMLYFATSTNLWSCLPAGCTRAQSSGRWAEGRVAAGDPPPSCAGASPLWPTFAGDTPTHRGRPWPGRSPHEDVQCLFCLCLSPNGYDNLGRHTQKTQKIRN